MIRIGLLGAGVSAAAYGGLLLVQRGWANLEATLTWLIGGVVIHDAVLAPATLAVAWAGLRLVRRERLAPWTVGVVLLAPLTLLAIPVLGRFGARPDNPTLLDRSYWAGWSGLVVVVVAGILVARHVERRQRSREPVPEPVPVEGGVNGPRDGGR
jgi:hypothetical protein